MSGAEGEDMIEDFEWGGMYVQDSAVEMDNVQCAGAIYMGALHVGEDKSMKVVKYAPKDQNIKISQK
jgi:hypothetical protein